MTFMSAEIQGIYEKDDWQAGPCMSVVYFDQLLGAAHTQKLVELLFISHFQPFLFILTLQPQIQTHKTVKQFAKSLNKILKIQFSSFFSGGNWLSLKKP